MVFFELFRVLQVSREGKCTHSDVPRQLIYGTMVYVRQTIVADASLALSKAVTIATRYSCVRRQFGSQDGGPETQVMVSQAYRVYFLIITWYLVLHLPCEVVPMLLLLLLNSSIRLSLI